MEKKCAGLTDGDGQWNCLEKERSVLKSSSSVWQGMWQGSCVALQYCTHTHNFTWTSNTNKAWSEGHIPALQMVLKLWKKKNLDFFHRKMWLFLSGHEHSCQSPSSSSSSHSLAFTCRWGYRKRAFSSCCSLRGQGWSRDRCGDCNYTLWEAASAKPKYPLLLLVSSRFTSAGSCDSDLSSQVLQESSGYRILSFLKNKS